MFALDIVRLDHFACRLPKTAATHFACKHGNCLQYCACDNMKAGKHVVKLSSFRCVQAYPKIYQSILQGSAAVQQICKHGPVDVSSLAMRLTAGVDLLTIIRLHRQLEQHDCCAKHCWGIACPVQTIKLHKHITCCCCCRSDQCLWV